MHGQLEDGLFSIFYYECLSIIVGAIIPCFAAFGSARRGLEGVIFFAGGFFCPLSSWPHEWIRVC